MADPRRGEARSHPRAHAQEPIHTAGPADASVVVAVLAEAFQNDPVTAWVFPGAQRRRAVLPSFFHAVVDDVLDHGEIYLTSSGAGVMLFIPPDTPAITPAQRDAHQRRLRACTGEFAERAVLISRLLEERHPRQCAHYYMVFGAVRPARRGRGIFGEILRSILDRADVEAVGTYGECSTPHSLRLMLRHGFRDLAPLPLPEGPSLYPVWRDPLPRARRTVSDLPTDGDVSGTRGLLGHSQ
jgi:GNAT superfamily N-acetyltransferase